MTVVVFTADSQQNMQQEHLHQGMGRGKFSGECVMAVVHQ